MEPENSKAYYRQGIAKLMLNKANADAAVINSARKDFATALSFNPPKDQQKILSKKLNECKKLLQESTNTQYSGSQSQQMPKSAVGEKTKRRYH